MMGNCRHPPKMHIPNEVVSMDHPPIARKESAIFEKEKITFPGMEIKLENVEDYWIKIECKGLSANTKVISPSYTSINARLFFKKLLPRIKGTGVWLKIDDYEICRKLELSHRYIDVFS
ncbi:hypothetical protein Tco_0273940 [Tanacetum coccineum]